MSEGFLFEKLAVYQKALDFADRVSSLTSTFPRACWFLVDQFGRASVSIALNIAEGNGRRTGADRGRFFIIARGSVHECVPLIEICRRKRLLSEEQCRELRREADVMGKMLSGLIKRALEPDSVAEDEVEYGTEPEVGYDG